MQGVNSTVVLFCPTHNLSQESGAKFKSLAAESDRPDLVSKQIYGRSQKDPRDSKLPKEEARRVCDKHKTANAISMVGEDIEKLCSTCSYNTLCWAHLQRESQADLYLLPHVMSQYPRPPYISPPRLVIIDENPIPNLIRQPQQSPDENDDPDGCLITVDELRRSTEGKNTRVSMERDQAAQKVLSVLDRSLPGFLDLKDLRSAGLSNQECDAARSICLKLKPRVEWRDYDTLSKYVNRPEWKQARLFIRESRFWNLLGDALATDACFAGRLELMERETANGMIREIAMRWLAQIHPSYRAPTLILDATLDLELLNRIFPDD